MGQDLPVKPVANFRHKDILSSMTSNLAIASLIACLMVTPANAKSQVDFSSFGSLRIGESMNQINRRLNEHIKPPAFPEADVTGRCFQVQSSTVNGVTLMFLDKVLVRIDIHKPGIRTIDGVSVGDSESAVIAAYKNRLISEPHAYDESGKYLTALSENKKTGVRFEILDGKVGIYYLGTSQAIQFIEGCA